MAWSWSHTAEAYDNACENVHNQDREWLEVAFAEWHACRSPSEDSNEFNQRKYNAALKRAKKLPDDVLADYIWERMSEYATCTNGGFEAYACPYGCHLVSFDHKTIDAEVEASFAEDWPIAHCPTGSGLVVSRVQQGGIGGSRRDRQNGDF